MDHGLFRKNTVLKEAGGCLKATEGKRITTLLSLYPNSFLLLSVFFSESCLPWQAMLKFISTHFRRYAPSQTDL